MPTRISEDAGGGVERLAVNMVPVSLHAEMRRAFGEWLDAHEAWWTLLGTVAADKESIAQRRRLQELEQRVESTAKAFNQAKQRCSDSPLYAAMLHAAIAGAPPAVE